MLPGKGCWDASVFAAEQTGEYTLVTLVLGEDTITIKMPRGFKTAIHDRVGVRFSRDKGFVFDGKSEERTNLQLASV